MKNKRQKAPSLLPSASQPLGRNARRESIGIISQILEKSNTLLTDIDKRLKGDIMMLPKYITGKKF